ncbi:ribonuclease III [Cylindrobasidium torrendii FP15055 ss-10]|uniref:Ribonuclease III n=1 Tax=Cylindrobasidium torrendii FP15055 ss-10 TaxID=1314674 RepID=A0A0D7BWE7_9AGAR|nr:ribonuclease III [Cylindrobasidium torrendii FP15055 ss-10]
MRQFCAATKTSRLGFNRALVRPATVSVSVLEDTSPMIGLKPDLGEGDRLLPPLPTLLSAAINEQVFTHRSYFARPTRVFEDSPDDPSPDNEKLEHLGDSVLGLVVTHFMLDMYPTLRVGPSTKMRALLVGNATLAEISVKYKLPERLRVHPAQALTLQTSVNIQADLFESFVGGLYCDQGLAAVTAWLTPLFIPYADLAYRTVRTQHGLPPSPASPAPAPPSSLPATPPTTPPPVPARLRLDGDSSTGHLGLFNHRVQRAGSQLEWVYSSSSTFADDAAINSDSDAINPAVKAAPVWHVTVFVDGVQYGRGSGLTKKVARNGAAKEGLRKLDEQENVGWD